MIEFDRLPASGIGSWPGEDVGEAVRMIFAEVPDLPYLPELPARGAAAGMIGRACAQLVGMSVDLQPAGWRLTDAPGIDARRARSLFRADLDALEEHAQGWTGPVKLAVTGPWTLAATVERPRGDLVLADHGARRDLAESLAEGLTGLVAELRRRLPDVGWLVQLDEPSLPGVLAGSLPTASGFSRHRAVERNEAIETLRTLRGALEDAGADTAVHCCAGSVEQPVPFELLRTAGFRTLLVDLGRLRTADWDQVAELLEDGGRLGAGVLRVEEAGSLGPDRAADRVLTPLRRLGLDPDHARRLVITPCCGLAGATPADAVRAHRVLRRAAAIVEEQLAE
ncbi:methionine synthase II (cobalamin-independent) [Friedmanniella endophytica]|uniref:Methionine synthase II (Cobalamin-independent) n=1 Tax=Microlunatus kandeliicorticis TaxID=1759536 RepID=A0A7W3IU65_9ACTN|nr:methionine synthase [Microlunatus kandeliicorticis]MBA8795220.1 methionine synthase II (cobalamin-independent) [Microlunatus kandeliicorticis]